MFARLILSCLAWCFVGDFCIAWSQRFDQDVPKYDIYDVIADFVSNREQFQKYAVLVQMSEIYENVKSPEANGVFYEDFAIFDDFKDRRTRVDRYKFPVFNQDLQVVSAWQTRFEEKGQVDYYSGKEQASESARKAYERNFPYFDPWMLPITEISLQKYRNRIGTLYWTELLSEENFLWAQEDGVRVRGEWSMGVGENKCYAQVYFDKNQSGLPVFARFLHPVDYSMKFAKKGDSFLTEIETVWQSLGVGSVPRSIRVVRENFGKNGKPLSTTIREYEFKWKSSFIDERGNFHRDIFRPGTLDSESVSQSFR